jgi:hypothetical protein
MPDAVKIASFCVASFLVVVALLAFVLRRRPTAFPAGTVILLAAIVGPLGVLLARFGANIGLPWWIYYTLPMLATVALPPLALRMKARETITYLVLAFLSAPAIHFAFAATLGWREYMPFLPWP